MQQLSRLLRGAELARNVAQKEAESAHKAARVQEELFKAQIDELQVQAKSSPLACATCVMCNVGRMAVRISRNVAG